MTGSSNANATGATYVHLTLGRFNGLVTLCRMTAQRVTAPQRGQSAMFCWIADFGHSSTEPDSPLRRIPGGAHPHTTAFGGEDSIVQNHVEQRFMNPDATVVFNKAELGKAIHEEADA